MEQHTLTGLPSKNNFHVAVIGGGASGILSAIQLLQQKLPIVVHVFNDGFEMGRGVAYSAISDPMVLNVPAGNMSAFPDAPDHFAEWLKERYATRYSRQAFVPRSIYGDYLQHVLQIAKRDSPLGSIQNYHGYIVKLLPRKPGYAVFFGDKEIFADAVILALGNVSSSNSNSSSGFLASDARYIPHPWSETEKILKIGGQGPVVILGSGLTAVDMILQLRQQGYQGNIHLISRRGQWPAVHKLGLPAVPGDASQLVGISPRKLIQLIHKKIHVLENSGGDWRQAIDGLRPATNSIWSSWSHRQRESFLRHLQTFWNIHRHRIAPEVWSSLDREIKSGSVRLEAGRITAIRPENHGLVVAYRPRCHDIVQELRATFVIGCTGLETLEMPYSRQLIQSLIEQNLAQLDPLNLGLATAPGGEVVNASGQPVPGLYAIGPLRRGNLWETTAIPEIRVQAKAVVREILDYLTNGYKSTA